MTNLVLLLLLGVTAPTLCTAYRASEVNPRTTTHGALVRDALNYIDSLMSSDSELRPLLSETIQSNVEALIEGAIDADHEGGDLTLFGRDIDRNSLSHFYNPDSAEGYRAAQDVRWVQTLRSNGMLAGFFSQALGPTISAADMVNWYYARSIQFYLTRGDVRESVRSLGYALHLLSDLTVPQHATDCGEENGDHCSHSFYENYVDKRYNEFSNFTAMVKWEDLLTNVQEASTNGLEAGLLAEKAAKASAPLLPQAASGSPDDMNAVAEEMLPLAKELTMTLILRYLQDLFNKSPVEAVVLQITRARIQGAFSTNERSPPDMVPLVRVKKPDGTLGPPDTRGYFADTNDVQPQQGINGFGWTFAKHVSPEDLLAGSVTFNVEIWDVDANFRCGNGCGKLNKRLFVDIGEKTFVDLTFSIGNSAAASDLASPLVDYKSGCNEGTFQENRCESSVRIDYVLGSSIQVNGVKKDLVVCDFANSISHGGKIAIAVVFGVMATLLFCICFGTIHWVKLKTQQKRSQKY